MKKITLFLLILAILLSGCGGKKYKASAKAISCAERAVAVGEQYMNKDISSNDAADILHEIVEDMDYLDGMSSEDETYISDSSIKVSILNLSISIPYDNFKNDSESYDKVLENIEAIKNDVKEYK